MKFGSFPCAQYLCQDQQLSRSLIGDFLIIHTTRIGAQDCVAVDITQLISKDNSIWLRMPKIVHVVNQLVVQDVTWAVGAQT
jgi:hypothetical protein